MSTTLSLFATAPRQLPSLLLEELRDLGASGLVERPAGVSFEGDLTLAYRVCLWSRLANRVLLQLRTFPATDEESLYQGVQQENWADTYHGEGMVGKSVVFGFMVLATIWFSDLPAYLFYGVAALLVIVVLALVWTARKQGNLLEQIREQQMRDHAAQKAARKASAGE